MLEDLLSGAFYSSLYKGYVDDGRNTDNAWHETTVVHFHCARDLGALLPLSAPFTEDGFNVRWLSLRSPEYREMYPPHREYVQRAKDVAAQKLSAGLLQLIVRWGRPEILKSVLASGSLVEQRQPQQVQQAFNDALKLATNSAYDTEVTGLLGQRPAYTLIRQPPNTHVWQVIDLLINAGARAADVHAAALFDLTEDKMFDDAFGYAAKLKDKRERGVSADDDGESNDV
eukprot:3348480-Prymnesium_polylepis.1